MNLASALSFYIGCCHPSCLSFIASSSYRVWITSNAKRQYKTLCNIKVKEHKKPTLNAISPFGSHSHWIDTLALYFFFLLFISASLNAGDSIFAYDPFTVGSSKYCWKATKKEDKTVSTPMWDSFRHFFFLHARFLPHTNRFREFLYVFFNKRPQREHTLLECT